MGVLVKALALCLIVTALLVAILFGLSHDPGPDEYARRAAGYFYAGIRDPDIDKREDYHRRGLELLEQAKGLDPLSGEVVYVTGLYQWHGGDRDGALASWRIVAAMDGVDPGVRAAAREYVAKAEGVK